MLRNFSMNISKNNQIYLLLILMAVLSISNYSSNSKIKKEITAIKEELDLKYGKLYEGLDSKIESSENKILKLKEEGFIEKEEFSDIAKKIRLATVLIS